MLSATERKERIRSLEKIYRVRCDNLRALYAAYNHNYSELARRLGMSAAAVHQMCGPSPVRSISEKVARTIESRLRLETGWLDDERSSKAAK